MHRLGPLSEAEMQRDRPGLEAVGVHRRLSAAGIRHDQGQSASEMIVAGAWSQRDDGRRVWRLAVDSQGAVGVRVHFVDFSVGAGRVWVYGGDTSEPRTESFTAGGPRGDGDFWSQAIFGSEAVIEFEPDPANPAEDATPFQIKEIAHLWRSLEPLMTPHRARGAASTVRSSRDFAAQLPAVGSANSSGDSPAATPNASIIGAQAASCQVDVACYSEWDQTSRAVALILFESEGSSYACSGTLLNTRKQSFTPYFLTAAHCVTSDTDARTVEAFWMFRSSTCNGEAPAVSQLASTLGSRQIVRLGDFDDTRGDFNLLLLDDVPDGAVFAGWDPNPVPLGTPVVGIHHPAGDQQRITFGMAVPDRYYGTSNAYLIVEEDLGRTEQGSSGSGLFSASNVLRGALSFGPVVRRGQTVCDLQPSYVGYSSFSALYPSVSNYLEDLAPPPPDPNTPLVSGVPREFSLAAVRRPALLEEPLLRVVVPENAVSLTIGLESVAPASADVDLYARYEAAPVVSGGDVVADFESLGPAGVEHILIDGATTPPLRAGTYYVRLALITRATSVVGKVRTTLETGPALTNNVPTINAILHAADQRPSPIAPGQLVSIYGIDLGDPAGVQPRLDTSGRIPTTVEGVTVEFGGVAAPLLFLRSDQINAQVPYEIAGLDSVSVTVSRNGRTSQPFPMEVTASAPQIFTILDGGNRGVVFNQDGSLNTPDNPIARGQIIVFYVSGEGVTNPALPTGMLAPLQSPTLAPTLPVSVAVGGAPAEILYAGIPPGLTGVMQVNARVSTEAVAGPGVFLVIRVGGIDSHMVTLSVN